MLNAAHLCKFCGICPNVCANEKATQGSPFLYSHAELDLANDAV
jgi:hypothetical protein